MTQIAVQSDPVPIALEVGSALPLGDEELYRLCVANPELRIERTAEGDLVVMTPVGGESSHRNSRITAVLVVWADQDGTGRAFDSSGGFTLPNGAMRSPDAAWVLRSRLDLLPGEAKKRFLPLVPDFVVELRSPTDRLPDLLAKMAEYRDQGARLGWLIDPEEVRVYVYRPGREVEVLDSPTEVTADPELPGFRLDLRQIWQSI